MSFNLTLQLQKVDKNLLLYKDFEKDVKMKCMHINIRKAAFILLTVLINRIHMGKVRAMFIYS